MVWWTGYSPPPRQLDLTKMQPKLTAEELAQELRDRYSYNPLTGQLIHLVKRSGIGKQRARYKYTSICVRGVLHRLTVHQAIWLWYYGSSASQTIDHIDRDKANNRIWNLRDVDMFAQNRNTSQSKLTITDVQLIKQRLSNGELQRVIAADYGVSRRAIGHIKAGSTWPEVLPDSSPTPVVRGPLPNRGKAVQDIASSIT